MEFARDTAMESTDIIYSEEGEHFSRSCSACKGSGLIERTCEQCHGSGCTHCHGTGREDVGCPRCEGRGKIIYSY